MKILLITLEPPLEVELAARGNMVRAAHLVKGLEAHGHEVRQTFRQPYDKSPVPDIRAMYRNTDELARTIEQYQPDAIVLGYWMLTADLPPNLDIPLVMDFIAPRPLEALYEPAESRDLSLQKLLDCLARADFFLVGNQRQADLLIPYLIQAGLDVRQNIPVGVVPIAAEPAAADAKQPVQDHWLLVGGGVEWPWRIQQAYIDSLSAWLTDNNAGADKPVHLMMFGGDYPKIQDVGEDALTGLQLTEPVHSMALHSYADYTRFLEQRGHIGIELAEFNVERYFSQSFRAMEFLRHGMPVICNDFINLAGYIEDYQAGWLVSQPEQLPEILAEITGNTREYQARSGNALRLINEQFQPADCIAPLISYLNNPVRTVLLDQANNVTEAGGGLGVAGEQPVAGKTDVEPDKPEEVGVANHLHNAGDALGKPRLRVLYQNLRARIPYPYPLRQLPRHLVGAVEVRLARLFSRQVNTDQPGNVVIVTRADLYPTDHGGAVKIVETAKALSLTGRDVAIVTSERHRYWLYRDGQRFEKKLPFWLKFTSLPERFSMLLHYARDVPPSNAFLYLPLSDNSFMRRTLHVAKKIKANVYQAEFPAYVRPCLYAKRVRGGSVVLVQHNVEYERLKSQEKRLTEEQYQRLKQLEIDFCNLSDAVICVSENDREKLEADGVHRKLLHLIPHGVDLSTFDQAQAKDIRRQYGWAADDKVLVYHGTYQYPPNLNAIKVMASEILPRLHARGWRPKVLAVGKMAPKETIHKDICFSGSVEIVAEYLKAADVAVVPLLDGGGTRMKIIDYFACGVPVVSTSKGIEGIPARPGLEAFIDDDWDVLADHIVKLMEDPKTHQKLVSAGRKYAQQLDWRKLAEDYVRVFGDNR